MKTRTTVTGHKRINGKLYRWVGTVSPISGKIVGRVYVEVKS